MFINFINFFYPDDSRAEVRVNKSTKNLSINIGEDFVEFPTGNDKVSFVPCYILVATSRLLPTDFLNSIGEDGNLVSDEFDCYSYNESLRKDTLKVVRDGNFYRSDRGEDIGSSQLGYIVFIGGVPTYVYDFLEYSRIAELVAK